MSTVQPCFNELSLREVSADNIEEKMRVFVALLTKLRAYGIRKVLYDVELKNVKLSESLSLEEFCLLAYYKPEYASLRGLVSMFMDMRHYPSEADKQEQYARYSNATIAAKDGKACETDGLPIGLFAAHVLDTFAVGFKSNNSENESLVYKLILDYSDSNSQGEVEVYCITSESDCNEEAFSSFLADKDIEVPKASRKNSEIRLPVHHSLQRCTEHAKLLIQDEYVEEILDSLPFVERREYIHHVYRDGIIHVRMFWEQGGYGLKVATSGRDLVQTKWIANHLAKRYGHM